MVKKSNVLMMVMLCLFVLFFCAAKVEAKEYTNIIIMFADDMGYGDLSCYGHPNIRTVNLDKMADEGIRFTSFYAAAPVCTPSRAALMTGRYPIRNAPNNFGPGSKNGLPVDEVTIAEVMKGQGYQTMAIGKWHLGDRPEFLPTSRGFDKFYGLPYSNDMILPWCPWLTEKDKLYLYENDKQVKEIGYDQDELTINYTKKALEFIRSNKDKPFFLYLAHSMPHMPISTTKEFLGKSKAGLYGDVVETIDWSAGEIFSALKEEGLDDKTLVVFTSDNGPWQNIPDRMLQRGNELWHGGSAGLLRGCKGTTYEGGFRVPGIIRWPGQITGGQVLTDVVTTMDMFVTLIDIAGGEVPGDRVIDGRNVLPLLKGQPYESEEVFFYLRGRTLQAVRKGEWKLRDTKEDGVELYNLKVDPSEMRNMAEREKDKVEELSLMMKEFARETGAKLEAK